MKINPLKWLARVLRSLNPSDRARQSGAITTGDLLRDSDSGRWSDYKGAAADPRTILRLDPDTRGPGLSIHQRDISPK